MTYQRGVSRGCVKLERQGVAREGRMARAPGARLIDRADGGCCTHASEVLGYMITCVSPARSTRHIAAPGRRGLGTPSLQVHATNSLRVGGGGACRSLSISFETACSYVKYIPPTGISVQAVTTYWLVVASIRSLPSNFD